MAILFIIRAYACIYLVTSIIDPDQTATMTALLLSLMVPTGKTSRLNHIVQCICLLLVFVVLYTFTCINAIKNLTAPPAPAPVPSSLASSSSPSKSPTSTAKQTSSKNNNATVKTPMRSTADLATSNDKQVEPIAAAAAAANNNNNNNNNNIISSNDNVTPSNPPPSSSTLNDAEKDQLTQLINNDTIIKKQDPTATQVIPMKAKQEHVDVAEKDQVAQPTIPVQTPEPSLPQQQILTATSETATNVDEASEHSSNKEQYYEEINKKGNDLMAFSDNLQRIFDEPPTPSPDHNVRPFSMVQTSTAYLDEAISTTPALTPPNQSSAAGSTLSRKSSLASQNSVLKSKLQQAFQKVTRSSTINNPNNNKQQQQHYDDITAVAPEPSKSKRFSSMRFSRRKTAKEPLADTVDMSNNNNNNNAPTPKKSTSTTKSVYKKVAKRMSKILS